MSSYAKREAKRHAAVRERLFGRTYTGTAGTGAGEKTPAPAEPFADLLAELRAKRTEQRAADRRLLFGDHADDDHSDNDHDHDSRRTT